MKRPFMQVKNISPNRRASEVAAILNAVRCDYAMCGISMRAAENRPQIVAAKRAIEAVAQADADTWHEALNGYRAAWLDALKELIEEQRESIEMVEVAHG